MYPGLRTVIHGTTARRRGAVKKSMAITAAGLILVLGTAFPAAASRCGSSAQTITRIAGLWSSMSGPIVTAAVDSSGVAWTVGPDARLDHVTMERSPTSTDGATVASAVMLPGSDTGFVSIVGDEDVEIRFVGTACHAPKSDDVIVEVEQATPIPAPDVHPAVSASFDPTPSPTAAISSSDVTAHLDQWLHLVRRICRFLAVPL